MAEPSSSSFPTGVRVLVVASDSDSLKILEEMLIFYKYQVTTCRRGQEALSILGEDRNRFDLIICEQHLPEIDGFTLLQIIGSKTDIPVVSMSSEYSSEAVMKGVMCGACDFLVKPFSPEQIRVIWQHVLRRRQCGPRGKTTFGHNGTMLTNRSNHADNASRVSGPSSENLAKRNYAEDKEDEEDENEASPEYGTKAKKPRIIWSADLHEKFVEAVHQLGVEKAVPKKILERMQEKGVTELTRENVASHLQKFRLYVRRRGESLEHSGSSSPFVGPNGFEPSCSSNPFGHTQHVNNNMAMIFHEQMKYEGMTSQLRQARGSGVSGNLVFGANKELPLLEQAVQMRPHFPNGVPNAAAASFANNSLFGQGNSFGHRVHVDMPPHPMHMLPQNIINGHDHHQLMIAHHHRQNMIAHEQALVSNGSLYVPFAKESIGGVLSHQDPDPHEAQLYAYDQDHAF